ncbi:phage tail protein, partial [Pantoea sp. FN0305]
GLGEAKYVVSRGANANGSWAIWSDGAIELFGVSPTIVDGLSTVTYPITLPASSPYITTAERISSDNNGSGNTVHVSSVIDTSVTKSGFKARCQNYSGAPSSSTFVWRVYYAPI